MWQLEAVLVVEEQEEQVVKLRKGRGGVVGELVESKEETSNKLARFPAATTKTRTSSTNKRQHFLKPPQQLNFVFGKREGPNEGERTAPRSPSNCELNAIRN